MSFADDAELTAFVGRDHMLLGVTADAVTRALEGASLTPVPGRDMHWVAMAVRRSLAISQRNVSDGPERTSNADVRTDLERLADMAGSTWRELFECDEATHSRIWTVAWRHWDGEGGNVGEPQEYRRFRDALAELDWLSEFLRQAARETESPRGPWRAKERKWVRIERGQYLAVIFEAAFGRTATVNNYPNDPRHKTPTKFMDFYSRMVTLAFGPREAENLSEVVKEACRRHRQQPAQFGKGIIPGL